MVSKQRQIVCDLCASAFTVNDGFASTKEIRAAARRSKWSHRGGRDWCPECAAAEKLWRRRPTEA